MTDDSTIEYLDLDDLLALATAMLGDPPPVRDVGLLGAAVARPRTSAFGADAYGDLITKAAALLHSVVNDHPLIDGNKRLGWLSAAVFLEINGCAVTDIPNDLVYELVMRVAGADIEVDEIASLLRELLST